MAGWQDSGSRGIGKAGFYLGRGFLLKTVILAKTVKTGLKTPLICQNCPFLLSGTSFRGPELKTEDHTGGPLKLPYHAVSDDVPTRVCTRPVYGGGMYAYWVPGGGIYRVLCRVAGYPGGDRQGGPQEAQEASFNSVEGSRRPQEPLLTVLRSPGRPQEPHLTLF